jgi:hypothetical protein
VSENTRRSPQDVVRNLYLPWTSLVEGVALNDADRLWDTRYIVRTYPGRPFDERSDQQQTTVI